MHRKQILKEITSVDVEAAGTLEELIGTLIDFWQRYRAADVLNESVLYTMTDYYEPDEDYHERGLLPDEDRDSGSLSLVFHLMGLETDAQFEARQNRRIRGIAEMEARIKTFQEEVARAKASLAEEQDDGFPSLNNE